MLKILPSHVPHMLPPPPQIKLIIVRIPQQIPIIMTYPIMIIIMILMMLTVSFGNQDKQSLYYNKTLHPPIPSLV